MDRCSLSFIRSAKHVGCDGKTPRRVKPFNVVLTSLSISVQEGVHEQNQRFAGRVLDVLVEGTSKRDEDVLAGRSPHNVTVHAPIPAGKTIDELEGTIVKVRIDEFYLVSVGRGRRC